MKPGTQRHTSTMRYDSTASCKAKEITLQAAVQPQHTAPGCFLKSWMEASCGAYRKSHRERGWRTGTASLPSGPASPFPLTPYLAIHT